MNTIFFSAIATLAITTATLQPSLAQDQSPAADGPVSVASCEVVAITESFASGDDNFPNSPGGASVWVTFQNHSDRTVTDVTFLLDTSAGPVMITDKGRFSSGVVIRHILGPFADLQGDETCRLYSAQFEDGPRWQRP